MLKQMEKLLGEAPNDYGSCPHGCGTLLLNALISIGECCHKCRKNKKCKGKHKENKT